MVSAIEVSSALTRAYTRCIGCEADAAAAAKQALCVLEHWVSLEDEYAAVFRSYKELAKVRASAGA